MLNRLTAGCLLLCAWGIGSAAGAAEWKILKPVSAPPAYAVAAQEFQKFYEAVTGVRLGVTAEPDASANLVVIGSDSVNGFCRTAVEQKIIPPLGVGAETDDYRIKSAEKDGRSYLFLAGGNGRWGCNLLSVNSTNGPAVPSRAAAA